MGEGRFRGPKIVAALTALLLAWPAIAQVPDDPTRRISEYADRALDFTPDGSTSYTIKRTGKPVSDLDLATSSQDPVLEEKVRQAAARSRSFRIGVGLVGLPLGLIIGIDNFYGNRTKKDKLGNLELPPSILAPFPSNDALSFGLAVGGAILALYGAWQVGELVGETTGAYKPRYLEQDEVKEAVKSYNDKLALELGLEASQVATFSVAATSSPAPSPLADTFPAGEPGSGAWAIRQAVGAATGSLGADFKPYLAWTSDLPDFQTGIIPQGAWHVLMAGDPPKRDVEVSVPRFGGSAFWREADPAFTPWRSGTNLAKTVQVDDPQALRILQPEYLARYQVGRLRPDSVVVLYPFYERLKEPIWTVRLGGGGGPEIAVNASNSYLVELKRFK